jgi:hypothetical protein
MCGQQGRVELKRERERRRERERDRRQVALTIKLVKRGGKKKTTVKETLPRRVVCGKNGKQTLSECGEWAVMGWQERKRRSRMRKEQGVCDLVSGCRAQ